MSLESTLHNVLTSYPDCHILVAYSGGIDSQVLLNALANLKKTPQQSLHISNAVSVCHVNHGLSHNAKHWEDFAQQQCDLHQFELDICRVHVKAKAQHSLEELARDARYAAIDTLIIKKKLSNVIVLTGHHSDDQAETFLLALKRGSGVKGLSAMKPVTSFNNILLIRPLLTIARSEIEEYAFENKLKWIEDESNEDIRFDRNFIRHDVMPTITKRWPSFLKTLNRSAEHCQEADLLLNELAQQDLEIAQTEDKCLSLNALKTLSQARFNNLIRYFLSINSCLMPSKAQLAQLQHQLLAKTDKSPAVKLGEYWLRRYKNNVYLTKEFKDITAIELPISMEDLETTQKKVIELPDGLGKLLFNIHCNASGINPDINEATSMLAPQEEQKVSIRFTHHNPICVPAYRQHSRPLKKVLQELNIPTWERKRLPFLYYDDELVAVLGYFVCKLYLPKSTAKLLSTTWIK